MMFVILKKKDQLSSQILIPFWFLLFLIQNIVILYLHPYFPLLVKAANILEDF